MIWMASGGTAWLNHEDKMSCSVGTIWPPVLKTIILAFGTDLAVTTLEYVSEAEA